MISSVKCLRPVGLPQLAMGASHSKGIREFVWMPPAMDLQTISGVPWKIPSGLIWQHWSDGLRREELRMMCNICARWIRIVLATLGVLWCTPVAPQETVNTFKKAILGDGVEHWWNIDSSVQKPRFFRMFEQITQTSLPPYSRLPFGRSVAFLVGVSDYENLVPDLPFVRNDIEAMRRYLLEEGGFDEVYVALDRIVTIELVESYMINKFPVELGESDRLLFYFAG